jgi:hypothetical protein
MATIRDSAAYHKLTSGDPESFSSQFFALLEESLKQQANGNQLPGGDHVVHFNEMAAAFERLTTLVQDQQKALVKLHESDDKIFRKVNLFVEGQPAHQLAQWVWWLGSCLVLLILGIVFYLGFNYGADTVQDHASARVDAAVAMAQEAITANNHYRFVQPLPTPGR